MKNLMKIDRNKQSLWQNIFAVGISVAIAIPLALPAAFASEDSARSKRKEREFPTQEVAENCGGSCRGGGLTVDGESLDSYLAGKRMLEGEVNNLVGGMVAAIAKVDPESAKIFATEAHNIRWYKVDRPLEKLPANLTHNLVMGTHQTMAQVGGNVFIDYPHFSKKIQNETQKETMGAHEILEYRFLNRVGISSNVSLGSIWGAADYLGKKKFASKEEFRSTMAKYGFNFSHTVDKEKQISVKELAKQEKIVLQPIMLPVGQAVTLENVLHAQGICNSQGNGGNVKREDTLLYKLLSSYYTIPSNFISEGQAQPGLTTYTIPMTLSRRFENRLDPVNSRMRQQHPTAHDGSGYIGPQSFGTNSTDMNSFNLSSTYCSQSQSTNYVSCNIQADWVYPNLAKLLNLSITGVHPFPKLIGDTVVADSVYDTWGVLNKAQRIQNIAFAVSEEILNNNGILPLKNIDSDVVVPLSVNTNDYMACVTSELQKFAQPLAVQPAHASGSNTDQPDSQSQQSGE